MKRIAFALLLIPAFGSAAGWVAEEMPLQLAVRGPEDLKFKAAAEKQYLIFNLLGSGKIAFDAGDFATATRKWEALLQIPGLPLELDSLVRTFSLKADIQPH